MTEMIIASLSKIWHIIPIIIAIILFKKYITIKDKKNKMKKNEELEKNGLTLKVRTQKKYEESGYEVTNLETKEEGIDFIMTKDNKTLLVECKDISEPKAITGNKIKTFCDKAEEYIKTYNLEKNNTEYRYIIPYNDILDKSAIKIFADDFYKVKYIVL